jgi:succinate dehydrogenase / fumarate reductase iron-sulfur subunit
MCGTCAMTVNGVPCWTCRTPLTRLSTQHVTVEPLRHFPVIKDLVVDMAPFFDKFRQTIPHVVLQAEGNQLAIIKPSEPGRARIVNHLECIGCGCCYAGCGLLALDPAYLGPHTLNRVFTLVHDRRDAARHERLQIVDGEHGCWRCHTQTACMDVCPKEINTSDAIQDLKRQVLAWRRDRRFVPEAAGIPEEVVLDAASATPEALTRRDVLQASAVGVLGLMALAVGGPIVGAVLSPALRSGRTTAWSDLGPVEEFPVGKMIEKRYEAAGARLGDRLPKTAYILRKADGSLQALSPSCTHLGCPVRWSDTSRKFLCPCHGGFFDESGKNVGGPPKQPLDPLETQVREGRLFVRETA